MPERKVTLPMGKVSVDGSEVPIRDKTEGVYEYELEDGSVIRLGLVITQIIRMDDTYDNDDNPVYIVKHGVVTNTISALPERRRPKK